MTPREAVNDFVGRNLFALLAAALSFGIGYGVLKAELAAKADRVEVDRLEDVLRRVDERTARIERYLCRARPEDIGC